MLSEIENALKEAERVCKKQKVCSAKSSEILAKLLQELTVAKDSLANGASDGVSSTLQQLHKRLESQELEKQLSDQTKDLHVPVNKLGKVSALGWHKLSTALQLAGVERAPSLMRALQALDKAFVPDICKATRDVEFDRQVLNQVGHIRSRF